MKKVVPFQFQSFVGKPTDLQKHVGRILQRYLSDERAHASEITASEQIKNELHAARKRKAQATMQKARVAAVSALNERKARRSIKLEV